MSAPAPDIDALDEALFELRLRRYRLERSGDWESSEHAALTWDISGLEVERGRLIAAAEREEIRRLARRDYDIARIGGDASA